MPITNNILITIILFIAAFVFISIWSYKLGYNNLHNTLFSCAKIITEYTDDSCSELSFLGLVYDDSSPTLKQLEDEPNPHNLDFKKLNKLKEELGDKLSGAENKLGDIDSAYIRGQLNIIDIILGI